MKPKFLSGPFLVLMMVIAISSCEQAEVEPQSPKPADTEADSLLLHAGTIRGSLDGPALQAQFDSPYLLSEGPENSLYVYDWGFWMEMFGNNTENRKIRKISADGQVTTIFDLGKSDYGLREGFSGMTVDKNGNIFVSHENQIKKITPDGKNVIVVAGTGQGSEVAMKDGPALQATLYFPAGLTFSKSGCLYIMDRGNNAVRLLVNGKISTIAGGIRDYEDGDLTPHEPPKDGIGPKAEFDNPQFIAVDNHDNAYVTGGKFNLIRKVTPAGVVSNFLGNSVEYDGDHMYTFTGIIFAKNGKLYVNHNSAIGHADRFNFSINELTTQGVLTPLISREYNGEFPDNHIYGLYFPTGLVVVGDTLYTTSTSDHQIRKLKLN